MLLLVDFTDNQSALSTTNLTAVHPAVERVRSLRLVLLELGYGFLERIDLAPHVARVGYGELMLSHIH